MTYTRQVGRLHLFVAFSSGWLQCEQHKMLEYLSEEKRGLKAQLRNQHVGLTDADADAWLSAARVLVAGSWPRWPRL